MNNNTGVNSNPYTWTVVEEGDFDNELVQIFQVDSIEHVSALGGYPQMLLTYPQIFLSWIYNLPLGFLDQLF